jgi:nicotinamidase-related amidase
MFARSKFLGTLFGLVLAAAVLPATGRAQGLPPLAKQLKPQETAIILVDFQANFTAPDGAHYTRLKPFIEGAKMLDQTVELVKQARALGVTIVHATEGYTSDYREVDATNPGGFRRAQLARQAWKIGSKEAAYYQPLLDGAGKTDLVLPPRSQVSAFGGTGLNEILRAKGIKNVAIAGFTTDVCNYATTVAAYDLSYHVYALKDAMAPYYPELSASLLKDVYPMWSKVVGNQQFLEMLDPPAAPRAN